MAKLITYVKATLLLLLLLPSLLSAKDTVKVGVSYSVDSANTYYHPRHLAIGASDTLIFYNISGVHTTQKTSGPSGFPTFSTTPSNPSFQFQLANTGVYYYQDQAQGPQVNGVVYRNAPGAFCQVGFGAMLNTADSTQGTYSFQVFPNGQIVSAEWDFNDGTYTNNSGSFDHSFDRSGRYDVCLTVEYSNGCYATYCDEVVVEKIDPNGCEARFSYFNLSGNTKALVNLSNWQSNAYGFEWSSPELGFIGNQFEPTVTFPDTGWYQLCLTLTDTLLQCQNTKCDSIYIAPPPPCTNNITWYVDPQNPLLVHFVGLGSGGYQNSHRWLIDGDTVSSNRTFSHNFSRPGTYQLQYDIYNDFYCSSTDFDSIVVSGSNGFCSANFNYSLDSTNGEYTFTATTGGSAPFDYQWDFGPSATPRYSSQAINTVSYDSLGPTEVCLVIMDQDSCAAAHCKTIISLPPPYCSINFQSSVNGHLASFQNNSFTTSNGSLVYSWDFGDGDTSILAQPNHYYAQPGTYVACLNIYDSYIGCFQSLCDTIIITAPVCSVSHSVAYDTNYTYNFEAFSSPQGNQYQYSWDFGDGSSPISGKQVAHQYPGGGFFPLNLIAFDTINGCSTSTQSLILVQNEDCEADFQYTVSSSDPNILNFSALSNNTVGSVNYLWNFGQGLPQSSSLAQANNISFPGPGTYQVCVEAIDTTGCVSIYCDSVVIGVSSCVSSYQVSQTGNSSFSFTTTSQNSSGPLSHSWDFGDGTGSTFLQPNHVYLDTGYFQSSLVVMDNFGCWDTSYQTIRVDSLTSFPCTASFQVTTLPGDGNYMAVNTTNNPSPAGYYVFSADNNPNYFNQDTVYFSFPGTGVYDICLEFVDTLFNCSARSCETVAFNSGTCSAFFLDSLGTLPYAKRITPYYADLANVDSVKWTFGDGSSSQSSSNFGAVEHLYGVNGTFEVCLSVYADSCFFAFCDSITVQDNRCESSFTSEAALLNGLQFDFTSTSFGLGPYDYLWDFGDGSSSNQPNPTHTYSADGTYTVCVTVTDSINCISTFCDTVNASSAIPPCFNDFSFTYGAGTQVSFISSVTGTGIISYNWSFGDGQNSIQPNASHVYNFPGNYLVKLTTTDQLGCTAVKVKWVVISGGNCNANFANYPDSTNGEMMEYQFRSYFAGSNAATHTWDFGDGNTAQGRFVDHLYATPGWYQVKLTVTDSVSGIPCSAQKTKSIYADTLFFPFVPTFSITALGNNTVSFNNNTSQLSWLRVSSPPTIKYRWDFGNGLSSTAQHPIHTYADSGSYLVCLTVEETSLGKSRTLCDSINTHEGLSIDFIESFANLTVFPNPFVQDIRMEWNQIRNEEVSIRLFNAMGQLVHFEQHDLPAGQTYLELNLPELNSGFYMLELSNETGQRLRTKLLRQD